MLSLKVVSGGVRSAAGLPHRLQWSKSCKEERLAILYLLTISNPLLKEFKNVLAAKMFGKVGNLGITRFKLFYGLFSFWLELSGVPRSS